MYQVATVKKTRPENSRKEQAKERSRIVRLADEATEVQICKSTTGYGNENSNQFQVQRNETHHSTWKTRAQT
eukprot:c32092_g1_i1 orf=3-215(-)